MLTAKSAYWQDMLEWAAIPPVKITIVIVVAIIARTLILLAIRHGFDLLFRISPRQKESLLAPVRTLSQILSSVITVLIVLVAAINILDTLHFNTAAILTSAGVITLVAGIASQNILKDLVSGISILVDAKFQIGDCISITGIKGEIIKLGLKTTAIQDAGGTVHLIPNSEIKTISKIGFDTPSASVVIGYDEDTDAVIALLKAKLKEKNIPNVTDEYGVVVKTLEPYGVRLNIGTKAPPLKGGGVEAAMMMEILRILRENNIRIADPGLKQGV